MIWRIWPYPVPTNKLVLAGWMIYLGGSSKADKNCSGNSFIFCSLLYIHETRVADTDRVDPDPTFEKKKIDMDPTLKEQPDHNQLFINKY